MVGIDVSAYQGVIDWNKVKNSGVEFAIIKIIKKDNTIDRYFETNVSGCNSVGIPIYGVYNYSYATTVSKAKTDAKAVVKALNGRNYMVWLDVEDGCQKNLGSLLIDIINAYGKIITEAGLQFGVYTGYSFYNSYIKKYGISYPLWIARYGANNGSVIEKNRPTFEGVVAWQYTSKGRVEGVSGNCDMNIYYTHQKLCVPVAKPTLKQGSKGVEVEKLQNNLNCVLGTSLKRDGIFGANTKKSLIRFQQEFSLSPDGIYGNASYKKMLSLIG